MSLDYRYYDQYNRIIDIVEHAKTVAHSVIVHGCKGFISYGTVRKRVKELVEADVLAKSSGKIALYSLFDFGAWFDLGEQRLEEELRDEGVMPSLTPVAAPPTPLESSDAVKVPRAPVEPPKSALAAPVALPDVLYTIIGRAVADAVVAFRTESDAQMAALIEERDDAREQAEAFFAKANAAESALADYRKWMERAPAPESARDPETNDDAETDMVEPVNDPTPPASFPPGKPGKALPLALRQYGT